jgi:hypothetical protein
MYKTLFTIEIVALLPAHIVCEAGVRLLDGVPPQGV